LRALGATPLAVAGLQLANGEGGASRVAAQQSGTGVTAEQALQLLMEGNRRFVAGNLTSLGEVVRRRSEVASSQSPMAVIISCSDSRVPVEMVFDRTLGDLFVIRTAGQVIDDAGLASLTYGVDVLRAPLAMVMVMGHSRCGAVETALVALQGGSVPNFAFGLVQSIGPAVRRAMGQPGDTLDNAIRTSVSMDVEQIKNAEPLLAEDVRQGRLTVVGAYYDFQTGQVSIIS
jgi:carbonic anhydrase